MSQQGVPVSQVIQVSVNITPAGASFANFNSLLMLGSSDVIDIQQRYRVYEDIESVASDFASDTDEYKGAVSFFDQVPKPTQLIIGRWADTATKARNRGGALNPAQQSMSNWTPITNGGFHVTIDGGASTNVTGCDFSGQTTLDGVAAIITLRLAFAALAATCFWDSSQGTFVIESNSSGASSAVSFLTAPTAGTDISGQLKMDSTTGTLVARVAAETPLQAVTLFDTTQPISFYGVMFADQGNVSDNEALNVAAYIEAAANPHLFGMRTGDASALVQPDTTTIGYLMKQANYNRSFVFWRSSLYGGQSDAALLFGKGFTINFDGNNTEYTLMWKELNGANPDQLLGSQSLALNANNYNYYTMFNNGVPIVVNGKMASGVYFDMMQGIDWLANRIQTEVFNLLISVPKVAQTDAGMHLLSTTMAKACDAGVNNGLVGPGTWTAGGFGAMPTGTFLPKGYYIYAPPVSSQASVDRAARKTVPFQIAIKLAGAVQDVIIAVNVNQ